MRSTPWKASRLVPPSTTTSPDTQAEGLASDRRVWCRRRGTDSRRRARPTPRGGEVALVAILVQAHLRLVGIEIDEAGLRRLRMVRDLAPEIEQCLGDRRPGFARHRMRGLVAVAALLVGDPAELAAIGHPDAHLLAGLRHGRHVERRRLDDAADVFDQRCLRGRGRNSRAGSGCLREGHGSGSSASVVVHAAAHLLDRRAPGLGLQAPLDRAFRRPGLLARRRRRLGGLGDECGQPGAGVGAVLLLRAEAARPR